MYKLRAHIITILTVLFCLFVFNLLACGLLGIEILVLVCIEYFEGSLLWHMIGQLFTLITLSILVWLFWVKKDF